MDFLREELGRNLLRYAVGQAMGTCPCCGESMDASDAVLLAHGDSTALACATCYDRPAGSFTAGGVEVIDGRTLWKRRPASHGAARLWSFADQGAAEVLLVAPAKGAAVLADEEAA